MSTKKRVVSAVLAAAVGVSLLCGFGVAKKDYVYQQFETAVKDASAKVTIRAADTDHITVRYAALPDEEPLYDISVQDGRLVVEVLDDVDVDTTDDDGPALVRIRMEGHSIDPFSDRELTVTLPDKQYEQLEAGLAVGTLKVEGVDAKTLSTLKVEGVDAKTLSAASAAGKVEVTGVQAEQLELASAAGKAALRDARVRNAEIGAAAGSVEIEGVEADELSVGSAVGGVSLKQVTAGELEIGSAIGSLKLEDVRADAYTKAGFILHTSGQIQNR